MEGAVLNAVACEACRSKKCKCDRILPTCSQCVAVKLSCHYPESNKRGIPTGYIAGLEQRLIDTEIALFEALSREHGQDSDVVAEAVQALESTSLRGSNKSHKIEEWRRYPLQSDEQRHSWWMAKTPKVRIGRDHSNMSAEYGRHNPTHEAEASTNGTKRHREDLINDNGEAAPSKRRRAYSPREHANREIGLMRKGEGTGMAGFVGSASGIHFVRSVYGSIARKSSGRQETETSAASVVPGEEDFLDSDAIASADRPLWRFEELAAVQEGVQVQAPSYDTLLGWTRSYFDNWHPALPFLHVPTVLSYLQAISEERQLPSLYETIIVRSILSISTADSRQTLDGRPKHIPSELVFKSFKDALDSIQTTFTSQVTVLSLQAALCVQLFLVSMLRHNAASKLGGLLVRMAFQLGLHRCPSRYRAFESHERQLRRSLFWSIYCIDRHVCQSLGLPLGIRDDDLDVCYPREERHEESAWHCNLDTSQGSFTLLTFLAKHAKTKGLIMELRNKNASFIQQRSDQATLINAELQKWWNEIEDFKDVAKGSYLEQTHMSAYHEMVLLVLKHESEIALHRPTLASSKSTAGYEAAVQICIGASKAIINALHKWTSQRQDNASGSPHKPALLWPSMTWAVWMSAFVLLYAAAESHISAEIALRYTDRSLTALEHLSLRESVWPAACSMAIRELRSKLTLLRTSDDKYDSNVQYDSNYSTALELSEQQSHSVSSNEALRPSQQHADRQEGGIETGVSGNVIASTNVDSRIPSGGYDFTPAYSMGQIGREDVVASQSGFYALARPAEEVDHPMIPDFSIEGIDAFAGFDIPFWMDQDQYADLMGYAQGR